MNHQRFFSIMVILSMLIGAIPLIAANTDASVSYDGDYEYDITGANSVTITEYLGTGGAITIPSTLEGRDVTKIGDYAFQYSPVLVVTVPDTVTVIEDGAFYGCSGLQEVILSDSVITIGSQAFYLCVNLLTINLPAVESIGDYAFAYCYELGGLYTITLPASLDHISTGMFYYCTNLINLIVKDGPSYISDLAFAECSSLQTFITPGTSTYIGESAFYNCVGLVNVIISNGTTTVQGHAFEKCASLIRVRMSQTVTTIGSSAFAYCSALRDITFNRGVVSIGTFALAYSGIDIIYFQGLTEPSIGASWLEGVDGTPSAIYFAWSTIDGIAGCNSMATLSNWTMSGSGGQTHVVRYFGASNTLTIPATIGANTVWYIDAYSVMGNTDLISLDMHLLLSGYHLGSNAFAYCTHLTTVTIGAGASSLQTEAFRNCILLSSCTFENDVYYTTSLGEGFFQYCYSLTYLTIPAFIKVLGTACFYNSGLTGIALSQITSLGYAAFAECHSLISIIIPATLSVIGESAFYNCYSLSSLTIQSGVTKISSWAFQYCTSLTSVTTVSTITEIDDYAFEFCTGLTSFNMVNGITRIGYSVFHGCSSLITFTIPASVITLGDNWLNMTAGVFDLCTSLTSITVDSTNTVFSSSGGVLFDKDKTRLIQFPAGKTGQYSAPITVDFIMPGAFWSSSLTKVTIPSGVVNITYACFASCPNLEEVVIPDTVTDIQDCAFQLSPKLDNVVIPDSVTFIGENAFYFCTGLETIEIGQNVATIGELAFYSCTSLISVTIPDKVYLLDNHSFAFCSALTTVRIGQGIAWIGNAVFYECSDLANIYFYSQNIPYIGAYWIRNVNEQITGHALLGSSFPTPGETLYTNETIIETVNGGLDGLLMGFYIPTSDPFIPGDDTVSFDISGLIWVIIFFLPVLILGAVFRTAGVLMGTAIMAIVVGFTQTNAMPVLVIGIICCAVYALSLRGESE